MNRTDPQPVPAHHRYAPLAFALAGLAVAAVVAMAGQWGKSDPRSGFVGVLTWWGLAGWPAILYMTSSLGLGRLLRPVLRGAEWTRSIEPVLGLALLLFLSNGAATLGLLGGAKGLWLSWLILAPGLAGVFMFAREAITPSADRRSPWRWMAYVGAGVAVAAACAPPGWLFGSEGGGYDSLSYHLQLPKEWLASGSLAPLRHNVFSYFPSFVESAFMHLGAMSNAPRTPDALGHTGLVADGAWRLLSCQMLHALMMLHCAWMLGRLVRTVAARTGAGLECVELVVGAARLAFLLTPWTVVVGALSYNEMPLLTFVIGALIVMLEAPRLPSRGVMAGAVLGAMVGAAIGAKPTAVLFLAAPLAACVAWRFPVRNWPLIGLAGACVGAVCLAPWLVRNALDGSNPIFPLGLKLLGTNHWNADQAARFTHATAFDGTLFDRLKLVFMVDPSDPSGPRHRGMLHPQWLWLWAVLPAAIGFVWSRETRRAGALLTVFIGVQILAWLFATHVQARFLLPCVPVLLALGAVALLRAPRVLVTVVLVLMIARAYPAYRWYSEERAGEPNRWLELGPGFFSGHTQAEVMRSLSSREERDAVVANSPPPASADLSHITGVYLLGDATPLYWSGAIYNTTWDAWPFGDAVEMSKSEDPHRWSELLRKRGITHVFVNSFELGRLARSGLLDPRVTPERVKKWLGECTDPVATYPEAGCYLVRVRDEPSGAPR